MANPYPEKKIGLATGKNSTPLKFGLVRVALVQVLRLTFSSPPKQQSK